LLGDMSPCDLSLDPVNGHTTHLRISTAKRASAITLHRRHSPVPILSNNHEMIAVRHMSNYCAPEHTTVHYVSLGWCDGWTDGSVSSV